MSIMTILAALLLIQPLGQPGITWKTEALASGDGAFTLSLKGEVRPGYYTHPISSAPGGTSVTLDPDSAFEFDGSPSEDYETAIYKGETTVTGTYSISIPVRLKNDTVGSTLKGSISWTCCTGDECGMPEEFSFSLDFPQRALKENSVKADVHTDTALVSPAAGSGPEESGIWLLILEAVLWGLAMILTPCVFPMVPMTVSFFLKNGSGKKNASLFGLFIILLYTVPICVIIGATLLLGGQSVTADIFNWLATHWLPNILFFIIFMVFAASLLGAFEIVLPSRWVNGSDKKSGTAGIGGVFFLALTLVLVSFSCTGPIVGTVLIKSTGGEFWTPMVTMLAFSVAFALPFTVLAFFPSMMKKLPRSGGWLNSVKVVLGFIEIALGLKFLSVADQTYHWHILDREVYLAIWITVFSMLGFYLLGKLRFANDSPVEKLNVKRLTLAIATFSFVVYMIPGMWGAPLKALSGYLPPLETQDFISGAGPEADAATSVQTAGKAELKLPHGLEAYDNIDEALSAAAAEGKNVFVDITGYGCVNCREMEARVWSDPGVLEKLRNDYVIAALYNDDKTSLPESEWVTTAEGKVLKDVGRVNSYIARTRFNVNSQPAYAILDANGELVKPVRGYSLDIADFINFLTIQ